MRFFKRAATVTFFATWIILFLGMVVSDYPGLKARASGIVQSAYNLIQDEGSNLQRRSTVDFTGTGITCTDGSGKTNCAIPGIPSGFYTQSFTNQTSVTLAHSLNTTVVIIQCYNNGSPPVFIEWDTLTLTDANNATVTFAQSQSGICYVNSQSGGTSSVTKIQGSASIAFSSSIPDGSCAVGGTTITVTGANVGDPVPVGPSTNLASGVEAYGKVTSSNTVTVEVCNQAGNGLPVTPGTATYVAQVFH